MKVIGTTGHEICLKMLGNLVKTESKISLHLPKYSMVKMSCLNDAFLGILEGSPVEGEQLLLKTGKVAKKLGRLPKLTLYKLSLHTHTHTYTHNLPIPNVPIPKQKCQKM